MSSTLQSLVPVVGNLYAPPWMCLSPQNPGFRDEESSPDLPAMTITAGTTSLSNPLALDSDADYFFREFWFCFPNQSGGAPQDLRVRLRDGEGRLYTNEYVYAVDLNGPIAPPLVMKRGAVLYVDYQNAGADDITVQLVVKAYKRRLCDNVAEPIRSPYVPMRDWYAKPGPGEIFRSFQYPVAFDNSVNDEYRQVPIQMDNDADFYFRGLSGAWGNPDSGLASIGNVGLTFFDTNGLALSQLAVNTKWGGFGEPRENVLPNGGGRVGPVYPEILVPRGGVVQVSVSFNPSPQSRVSFSLRGVKIYNPGKC